MPGEDHDRPNSAGPARAAVVGIGASAGGVKALQTLFSALPGDLGVAFVVIAHLDPHSRSELPQILAARSRMSARQVTESSELRPNCIYVIPPDRQLQISDHEIDAIPFEEPRGHRMPIDFFFRSLAAQHGDGFAIVLSGAGSDGAAGVKAIKEAGGIVLVQDPDEAEYPPMPRAAIATEAVDFVLPLEQLAARLVELIRAKASKKVEKAPEEEDGLRRILAHLRVRTGHDFSHYKRSTVLRRISRRMQVTRKESFEEYYQFLRENPDEAQALLADLLISVTTFFRDAVAFDVLANRAIPHLFERHDVGGTIRVWIAGCATGEEAYSIGILLLEEAARRDVRPDMQIFATDMDTRALGVAREGVYSAAIEADLSEERLRRFFQPDGEQYRVNRELRDMVLFANHSILRDPPFSRVGLISCRNLLIYLNRDLQQQVLTTFGYALNHDGFLFLGSSESADHPGHLFRAIDREARLYRSTGLSGQPPMLPRLLGMTPLAERPPLEPQAMPPAARGPRTLHREALETESPPSILVDNNYRVLHLSETAGRYLQPQAGPYSADVTELVREEIRFELRRALNRVFERNEAVLSGPLRVRFNGAPHRLFFQARPVQTGQPDVTGRHALILFVEGEAVSAETAIDDTGIRETAQGGTVGQLQQELDAAHQRLRALREESEAANEELRAANEELQSINEEYRSTAEELETSKEELQSINEELQTLNSELKHKLDSVSRANSDLQNLMAASEFATLFLDSSLRIKRFTPRTSDLFNITQSDIGRPIGDFTHRLAYEELALDAGKVLTDLAPLEREVQSGGDRWFSVRIRPYRTVDNKIDGVVATFVDTTQSKALEARLRLLLGELTHRVKNVLAVVQGLVHQTWRNTPNHDDFMLRIDGRLSALANSHALLVESEWQGADLSRLIEVALGAYAADPSRLKIAGEPISLPADVATPLGLVLHELATNAVKYGALSNENGRIELDWALERGNNRAALRFHWKEVNGPTVKQPSTFGFGTRLIRQGLPGAKVDYAFRDHGVECTIVAPIPGASEHAPLRAPAPL